MKASIIIQARLGSVRFPNKVLKKIGNLTVIEVIYKRLLKSKLANEIIFAIPNNKEKLKLQKFIKNKIKCKVFCGSENNVLNRYYQSSKKLNSDIIVRVTGDCPLVDPKIIDKFIMILKNEK